jgi:hypothetical protein
VANAGSPSRPNQIDPLGAWRHTAPAGAERDLLGYPWLGTEAASPAVHDFDAGQIWAVTADLVASIDSFRRPRVTLRGPRSILRHGGRPVERADVAGLHGFGRPLVLIAEGTLVQLVGVGGSVSWEDGGYVSTLVSYRLPGGTTFGLTTGLAWGWLVGDGSACGMAWSDIACAAVIVPATHPSVAVHALRDALFARVEAAVR